MKTELQREGDNAAMMMRFGKHTTLQAQPTFSAVAIETESVKDASRILSVSTTIQIPSNFQQSQLALLLKTTEPLAGVAARGPRNGQPATLII